MDDRTKALAKHFDERLCDIVSRQDAIINALCLLLRAQGLELELEARELVALDHIEHPPVDSLGLKLDGVKDKPPPQVLAPKGTDTSVVNVAAIPHELEKRLAIVGDPHFQRFCQRACDHGIDPGEHPVRQAARVILSTCNVSTPYQLAEPEPAALLDAMFARFERWKEANG